MEKKYTIMYRLKGGTYGHINIIEKSLKEALDKAELTLKERIVDYTIVSIREEYERANM